MSKPSASVGFVGLGRMGAPMSARLVDAGYTVIGYDLSEDARRRAAALGVRVTHDLPEVASGAHALILMLPDSDAVAEVLGDSAMLNKIEPGTIVVDMSSSEPMRTKELATCLQKLGIKMIDAPVSGGVSGASKGTLTVMVGAEETDLAQMEDLLSTFGRVVRAGSVGAGHAVKALNNLLSATHLWATSEAMLAGERFGIDPRVMLSVFNSSSGRSGSTENKWPNFILPRTFNSGFGLRLMVKDMNIAVGLAEQVGAPVELGSRALALWNQAAAGLQPEADHTEVAIWLEQDAAPGG
jgi:3-hydroxyisobutyrate dehydrogenase